MKAQAYSTTVSSLLFMGMNSRSWRMGMETRTCCPQIEAPLFGGNEQEDECKPLFV